ncbi:hypothetical protein B484DRAFT_397059 [Ochromonadaceae sp. CCMP2298]|nr:hypothetical protein B484DRAFT_397059 [Ochromonadaceae sp. CCMP2298]
MRRIQIEGQGTRGGGRSYDSDSEDEGSDTLQQLSDLDALNDAPRKVTQSHALAAAGDGWVLGFSHTGGTFDIHAWFVVLQALCFDLPAADEGHAFQRLWNHICAMPNTANARGGCGWTTNLLMSLASKVDLPPLIDRLGLRTSEAELLPTYHKEFSAFGCFNKSTTKQHQYLRMMDSRLHPTATTWPLLMGQLCNNVKEAHGIGVEGATGNILTGGTTEAARGKINVEVNRIASIAHLIMDDEVQALISSCESGPSITEARIEQIDVINTEGMNQYKQRN